MEEQPEVIVKSGYGKMLFRLALVIIILMLVIYGIFYYWYFIHPRGELMELHDTVSQAKRMSRMFPEGHMSTN